MSSKYKIEDYMGKKFGKRTIIGYVGKDKHHNIMVIVRCECGEENIVRLYDLFRSRNPMCINCKNKKHGLCSSRLYNIWRGIKKRCLNKGNTNWKYYGGRGITICDEWKKDFVEFYNWAISHGYKDDLTIDRIDVNGIYEPNNCRWVTRQEQVLNRRIYNNTNGGYFGVKWYKERNKWRSVIGINSKACHIGYFKTKKEAVEARNDYIREHNLPHKIQEYVEEEKTDAENI